MKQPPGFKSPKKPDHVCCLTKAIYGLKQAPQFGFINAKSDSSLFVFHDGSILAYCLVYVNDLIITATIQLLLQALLINLDKNSLSKTWGPYIFPRISEISLPRQVWMELRMSQFLSTSVSLQLAMVRHPLIQPNIVE
ncbi:hypothetical protein AAG906_021074 [Vitis piasezkii]